MVRRGHTFQEDVQEMLSRFMTFDEAIASDHFSGTPARSRFSIGRTDRFTEIEPALDGAEESRPLPTDADREGDRGAGTARNAVA